MVFHGFPWEGPAAPMPSGSLLPRELESGRGEKAEASPRGAQQLESCSRGPSKSNSLAPSVSHSTHPAGMQDPTSHSISEGCTRSGLGIAPCAVTQLCFPSQVGLLHQAGHESYQMLTGPHGTFTGATLTCKSRAFKAGVRAWQHPRELCTYGLGLPV